MTDTNTDRLIKLIVDSTINLIKPQLENRVSNDVFETVRFGTVSVIREAIPFPLRMAINGVPASAFQIVETTVKDKMKTVVGTQTAITAETHSEAATTLPIPEAATPEESTTSYKEEKGKMQWRNYLSAVVTKQTEPQS